MVMSRGGSRHFHKGAIFSREKKSDFKTICFKKNQKIPCCISKNKDNNNIAQRRKSFVKSKTLTDKVRSPVSDNISVQRPKHMIKPANLTGQKYFPTKIFPFLFHIKPFIFKTFSETSKRLIMSRGGSRHFHKGAIFTREKNRISKQFVLRKVKKYRAVFQSENCKTW
jgi:hypothetical protein